MYRFLRSFPSGSCRAIDYYGLVELEYKSLIRETANTSCSDVNARTWGYHSLGAEVGVDFSYMLYADRLVCPSQPAKAAREWAGCGRQRTCLLP